MVHDIIVGDFGRQGTLRYFQEFTRVEKEIISGQLGEIKFFDEHRTLRYKIVGLLPDIKKNYINKIYGDSREFDSRVMLGYSNGPSPVDFAEEFFENVIPYIDIAVSKGTDLIRVIIPCNTLSPLARCLEIMFQDHFAQDSAYSNIVIKAPDIPGVVLRNVDAERLYLIGTPTAFKAYEQEISENNLEIEILGGSPEQVKLNEEIIMNCVRGNNIDSLLAGIDVQHGTLVSACTDVVIPGTVDSVELFARQMVLEAYGNKKT